MRERRCSLVCLIENQTYCHQSDDEGGNKRGETCGWGHGSVQYRVSVVPLPLLISIDTANRDRDLYTANRGNFELNFEMQFFCFYVDNVK